MTTAEIQPTEEPRRQRGMALRYPSITASTATAEFASRWLFGEPLRHPKEGDHRGVYLRYVLRVLYGADYRKRGARMLGVSPGYLSAMMSTGRRVSRRIVRRIDACLEERIKQRRRELRLLAEMVERVFADEARETAETEAVLSLLLQEAIGQANTHNPHSSETGRFVPRVQGKVPVLSEPGADRRGLTGSGRQKKRGQSP